MNTKDKCPYCHKKLNKTPKRKSKCTECGNYIYVRSNKLYTLDESVLKDTVKGMEYLNIPQIKKAKTIDELKEILLSEISNLLNIKDFHQVSSIYLNLGVMSEDLGNYDDCIKYYLLCCHYSAYKDISRYQELGMELTFDDQLKLNNYMISAPVRVSLEKLEITDLSQDDLGKLAVTHKINLNQKLAILEEILDGNFISFNNLQFESGTIVKGESFDTPKRKHNRSKGKGCMALFVWILFFVT